MAPAKEFAGHHIRTPKEVMGAKNLEVHSLSIIL